MAELEIRPTPKMRMRVTALVAISIVLSSTEMYLLAGGGADLFARRTTLTTYMPDAAGLTTDSDVRLSGLTIGDVNAVDLSGSDDPRRIVRIQMRILTRYLKYIPSDSETDVNADTIVSDKFVEIAEGKSALPVAENAVLENKPMTQDTDRAEVIQALTEKENQVNQLLMEMSSPETQIGRFILGSGEYDQVLNGVSDFDRSLHSFLNPRSELGQAIYSPELYNKIRQMLTTVDGVLTPIQNGEGTAGHLFASDEQYDDFVRQIGDLRATLADANAGRGSLGSLLQDDAAYMRVVRLLASTDAMLASVNAGDGQFGHLLTNAQLYESLNGSLQDLGAKLRDLREHPQKYLRVRHKIF